MDWALRQSVEDWAEILEDVNEVLKTHGIKSLPHVSAPAVMTHSQEKQHMEMDESVNRSVESTGNSVVNPQAATAATLGIIFESRKVSIPKRKLPQSTYNPRWKKGAGTSDTDQTSESASQGRQQSRRPPSLPPPSPEYLGGGGGGVGPPGRGSPGSGSGSGPYDPPLPQGQGAPHNSRICFDEFPIPEYKDLLPGESKIGPMQPYPTWIVRGALDRQDIFSLIASPNPLTRGFFCHSIHNHALMLDGVLPTSEQRGHMIVLACIGYCLQVSKTSHDDLLVRYVGESIAPLIPTILRSDDPDPQLILAVKALLKGTYLWYPPQQPPTVTIAGTNFTLPLNDQQLDGLTTVSMAITILWSLRDSIVPTLRSMPREVPLMFCFSVACQGHATKDKVERFCNQTQEQVNLKLPLTSSRVGLLYTYYGRHITDDLIRGFFHALSSTYPNQAVIMKLILQQASWAGLTQYVTIARALSKFKDFPWAKVDVLKPGQMAAYKAALEAVGRNSFYGFRKSLGVAAAKHYSCLAYVAKELMIKVGGRQTLRAYAGWDRNVPFQPLLASIVERYVCQKQSASH